MNEEIKERTDELRNLLIEIYKRHGLNEYDGWLE